MSAPPAKRQRAGTLDEPQTNLRQRDPAMAIGALSEDTVRKILLDAAYAHPTVQSMIDAEYNALVAREQATMVNFDHFSGSVWKKLNIDHRHESGSRQYQSAGPAATPESSLGTRISALETLRKMGKSIAMSGTDTLGSEVINWIVIAMSEEFVDKLAELVRLGEAQCIFEGLSEILEVFLRNPEDTQNETSSDGISEVYDNNEDAEDEGVDAHTNGISNIVAAQGVIFGAAA
ncbi:hypothetical protein H2199_002140 [Coniosporium tulheliwenetii]|uniref:Uncharacterized protein n=1 Tax=Coniosporium tulheliwenetii TaxID=3383036 RepID=A0ACC2ZHZ1_9PEZI|nr:hypothetical protein H2199_002140 [Cladosporium sp. JES 115]